MSTLLHTLQTEFDKFYDSSSREPITKRCAEETQTFKLQLKKLKAHLAKHIQDSESVGNEGNEVEKEKIKRRRDYVVDKLRKSHKSWDQSLKRQAKHLSQQHARFGKVGLAKLFDFGGVDNVYVNKLPAGSKKAVDGAISFHISRYNIGNLSVSGGAEMIRYLNDMYGIPENTSSKFVEMGQIVQDLKLGNSASCRKWCDEDSPLIFELYVLECLQLFAKGNTLETYHHLTAKLPPCSFHQITKHVSPILTQLVLGRSIQNIDETIQLQLKKCISLFTKEYCTRKNLPFDSPLFLIVLSGVISFKFFMKYTTIRAASHVDWTTEDELPFDVQLPNFLCHFHPIFICPVLKEETTEDNPPYSLPCHHILSKKSMERLSKNGTSTFKCPYCPVNASKSKTRRVNFVML